MILPHTVEVFLSKSFTSEITVKRGIGSTRLTVSITELFRLDVDVLTSSTFDSKMGEVELALWFVGFNCKALVRKVSVATDSELAVELQQFKTHFVELGESLTECLKP